MVFLIQNTQNRDTKALQLKLDELIFVMAKANNSLLDLEEMDEKDQHHGGGEPAGHEDVHARGIGIDIADQLGGEVVVVRRLAPELDDLRLQARVVLVPAPAQLLEPLLPRISSQNTEKMNPLTQRAANSNALTTKTLFLPIDRVAR